MAAYNPFEHFLKDHAPLQFSFAPAPARGEPIPPAEQTQQLRQRDLNATANSVAQPLPQAPRVATNPGFGGWAYLPISDPAPPVYNTPPFAQNTDHLMSEEQTRMERDMMQQQMQQQGGGNAVMGPYPSPPQGTSPVFNYRGVPPPPPPPLPLTPLSGKQQRQQRRQANKKLAAARNQLLTPQNQQVQSLAQLEHGMGAMSISPARRMTPSGQQAPPPPPPLPPGTPLPLPQPETPLPPLPLDSPMMESPMMYSPMVDSPMRMFPGYSGGGPAAGTVPPPPPVDFSFSRTMPVQQYTGALPAAAAAETGGWASLAVGVDKQESRPVARPASARSHHTEEGSNPEQEEGELSPEHYLKSRPARPMITPPAELPGHASHHAYLPLPQQHQPAPARSSPPPPPPCPAAAQHSMERVHSAQNRADARPGGGCSARDSQASRMQPRTVAMQEAAVQLPQAPLGNGTPWASVVAGLKEQAHMLVASEQRAAATQQSVQASHHSGDTNPAWHHAEAESYAAAQAAAELWDRTISPLAVLFNSRTGQLVAGLPPVIYIAHAHAQRRLQRRSSSQQQYIKELRRQPAPDRPRTATGDRASVQSSAPVSRQGDALSSDKAVLAEKGRQLRAQGLALEAVRDQQAAALKASEVKQALAKEEEIEFRAEVKRQEVQMQAQELAAHQARLDEQAFILEEQKLEYTAAAAQLAAMQARIDALGARLPSLELEDSGGSDAQSAAVAKAVAAATPALTTPEAPTEKLSPPHRRLTTDTSPVHGSELIKGSIVRLNHGDGMSPAVMGAEGIKSQRPKYDPHGQGLALKGVGSVQEVVSSLSLAGSYTLANGAANTLSLGGSYNRSPSPEVEDSSGGTPDVNARDTAAAACAENLYKTANESPTAADQPTQRDAVTWREPAPSAAAPSAAGGVGQNMLLQALGASAADKEMRDILTCPISLEIMSDPVSCADGHTYERCEIEKWLMLQDTSPLTNVRLAHRNLTPNYIIKNILDRLNARLMT